MSTKRYCLVIFGYNFMSAINIDEVIAIYINMFQFTNFTYYKLLPSRYHHEHYWNISMEISQLIINEVIYQNCTEHAARKQEKFSFCYSHQCHFSIDEVHI